MRSVPPADLDADGRGVGVQRRDEHLADEAVEVVLLFPQRLHAGSEGADHAVGEKDAQERPNERAADHLPQDFRRLVDRGHGLDDAEDGGDDAQGGKRIGDVGEGVRAVKAVLSPLAQLLFEHLLDLIGVVEVHDHRPDRVADHVGRVVILLDLRVLREDRG
ncbi:hypothetical protein GGQ59_002856 [Parvularcula dongshanensis]|uniref:Uncharacterized protein n=1 Tax=Parvularcula dongshanensis TaxID=1173995 RepID=A0A840I5T5_9PROT|nr:hypothetical protein [Parvularcula dongshanensis]